MAEARALPALLSAVHRNIPRSDTAAPRTTTAAPLTSSRAELRSSPTYAIILAEVFKYFSANAQYLMKNLFC